MPDPRVLGVIVARGGSRGVPRKNVQPLGGLPLIAHTIAAAERSPSVTRTIVSTDDEEIAGVAAAHGGEVPFRRPGHLASDDAGPIEVLQHALHAVEDAGDDAYDALLLLQPTSPFRTADDIEGAIGLLVGTGADSVISVVDVGGHHPARMKWLEGDRLVDPPFCEMYENQPRQQLRPMFIRNGAIYLTRRDVLLRGSLKGSDSRAWVMPRERSVNVDDLHDLRFAEWLLAADRS